MILRARPSDVVWVEHGRATIRNGVSLEILETETDYQEKLVARAAREVLRDHDETLKRLADR